MDEFLSVTSVRQLWGVSKWFWQMTWEHSVANRRIFCARESYSKQHLGHLIYDRTDCILQGGNQELEVLSKCGKLKKQ